MRGGPGSGRGPVVALALVMLALGGAGSASGGAKDEGDSERTTSAPTMNGVKDVVKDAAKDALGRVGKAGPAAPGAAPAVADPAAALAGRLTLLRRKSLKDDDFVDNDERNRDPFRSYLRIFIAKEGPRSPQVPAVFDKFALEELTLIGIVSGDAKPLAMFRDPGGTGQSVKRGDYLSKVAARVSKILSDRVILELNEVTSTGETRPVEKPVLVNPEGAQK
jgi:Tfp pilus assembly protein PilP